MELSSFSENIITETFERSGEKVELKINRDAFVPDYTDTVSEKLAPTMKRLEDLIAQHSQLTIEIKGLQKQETGKRRSKKLTTLVDFTDVTTRMKAMQREIAEVKREIYAEQLTCPVSLPDGSTTCILKGWDITENGLLIAPNKENLLRLPTPAVEALFDFVMSKMETVKKKVESETRETSESAPGGSAALRVVGQST
jgi:DNA-binding protein YbaB